MAMFTSSDLLTLACDLTAGLAADDRSRRLIAAVERVIPCEAAALLRLDGDALVPVAFSGLVPEIAGRRFAVRDHPRLDLILRRRDAQGMATPLRFPPDSTLADPYDGLMLADPHACARVHACMGCPLMINGEVIGVLTVDARNPTAFAELDDATVATFAAVAAAGLHTATLIETLEKTAHRRDAVLKQLVRDERERRGSQLLGTSPAMQKLRREIDLVAASDLTVLITGETGVGKELVAGAIHAASRRCDEPLVQVNGAALPESLAESELFGHLRGSFTGATADRAGKFEVADGGTLFLDEVGELPLAVQAKLLRALQQGEIQRLGADRVLKVDVRIIAATNRDLLAEQNAGRFRSDLYHRLSVYPLHIPPLRDRREDIPLLAGHVLDREAQRLGCGSARLDAPARAALAAYPWPGNVRELEHVLMRALVRAAGGASRGQAVVVTSDHLGLGTTITVESTPATALATRDGTLRQRLDDFTRIQVQTALAQSNGSWAAAARVLGLTPSNLQRLAGRLGLRN
jgi:anaerobic nitric oxide reductase transcription regulator